MAPKKPNWHDKLQLAKKATADKELAKAQEALDAQDVGYTSKLFVQALFPYRQVEGNTYSIESGNSSISIVSFNGVPYGKYPRLIMAYIITRAVENAGRLKEGKIDEVEARRIPLGHSMSHFLKSIGIELRANGGKRGNVTLLREQIKRLASSVITVQSDDGVHARGSNTQILDDWNLWFDPRDPNQGSFIESELVLTSKFFQHVAESPIPIDLNVLRELTKPRSMDIYIWLTLKQYWLAKNNRDAYTFTWDMMAANFATKELKTSAQWRDFRTDVKKAIHDILTVWPNAGITADAHGVTVAKTATSIRQRPPKPQLD
ncbi:replication protein RepA [Corynebacterium striatum]